MESMENARLRALRAAIELRSRMLAALRARFLARGFMEVETPVRLRTPALELHIDAEPSGDHYLRTSPELHMKRLLAAGCGPVFQIGPCFRRGERGALHNPEFSMLEWYRPRADYRDVLEDAREFVAGVARDVAGRSWVEWRGRRVDLCGEWIWLSVRDAFLAHAGWDPIEAYDAGRFGMDYVEKVEPALALAPAPVVLFDFPSAEAALARLSPSNPGVAERWELYVGGLELANAFSELTDAAEQRARFEACAQERRALGRTAYAVDELFLDALAGGMPDCAGAAFGLDRFLILLAGARSMDDVLPFRE